MTIGRMRFARWTAKVTDTRVHTRTHAHTHAHTHTAYVILIELLQIKCEINSYFFPRQQWVQECASVFALVRTWPHLFMTTVKVFYIDKLCQHKWLKFYYRFNSASSINTFSIMLSIIRDVNKWLCVLPLRAIFTSATWHYLSFLQVYCTKHVKENFDIDTSIAVHLYD
jgi:hypothetical protein